MKNKFVAVASFAVLLGGLMAGRLVAQITVANKAASNPLGNYATFVPTEHKDTVFSMIPAPDLAISNKPLYPNEYDKTTYWAIEEIRKAHQTLADAEKAGKTMDPNTALHDFPYWTRTYGVFIRHIPEEATGMVAEQHMGYKQHVVIMGGTGTVQLGGELQKPSTLMENGQPIWGETRAASITGGETFTVKEMDRVLIPPNTPALWKATSPGGLTFAVVKDTAKQYPWDLIR